MGAAHGAPPETVKGSLVSWYIERNFGWEGWGAPTSSAHACSSSATRLGATLPDGLVRDSSMRRTCTDDEILFLAIL